MEPSGSGELNIGFVNSDPNYPMPRVATNNIMTGVRPENIHGSCIVHIIKSKRLKNSCKKSGQSV